MFYKLSIVQYIYYIIQLVALFHSYTLHPYYIQYLSMLSFKHFINIDGYMAQQYDGIDYFQVFSLRLVLIQMTK